MHDGFPPPELWKDENSLCAGLTTLEIPGCRLKIVAYRRSLAFNARFQPTHSIDVSPVSKRFSLHVLVGWKRIQAKPGWCRCGFVHHSPRLDSRTRGIGVLVEGTPVDNCTIL